MSNYNPDTDIIYVYKASDFVFENNNIYCHGLICYNCWRGEHIPHTFIDKIRTKYTIYKHRGLDNTLDNEFFFLNGEEDITDFLSEIYTNYCNYLDVYQLQLMQKKANAALSDNRKLYHRIDFSISTQKLMHNSIENYNYILGKLFDVDVDNWSWDEWCIDFGYYDSKILNKVNITGELYDAAVSDGHSLKVWPEILEAINRELVHKLFSIFNKNYKYIFRFDNFDTLYISIRQRSYGNKYDYINYYGHNVIVSIPYIDTKLVYTIYISTDNKFFQMSKSQFKLTYMGEDPFDFNVFKEKYIYEYNSIEQYTPQTSYWSCAFEEDFVPPFGLLDGMEQHLYRQTGYVRQLDYSNALHQFVESVFSEKEACERDNAYKEYCQTFNRINDELEYLYEIEKKKKAIEVDIKSLEPYKDSSNPKVDKFDGNIIILKYPYSSETKILECENEDSRRFVSFMTFKDGDKEYILYKTKHEISLNILLSRDPDGITYTIGRSSIILGDKYSSLFSYFSKWKRIFYKSIRIRGKLTRITFDEDWHEYVFNYKGAYVY